MRGGHFAYNEQIIMGLSKELKKTIKDYSRARCGEFGEHEALPDDMLLTMRICRKLLKISYVMMTRIDYLLSGDDDEAMYRNRLYDELSKMPNKITFSMDTCLRQDKNLALIVINDILNGLRPGFKCESGDCLLNEDPHCQCRTKCEGTE